MKLLPALVLAALTASAHAATAEAWVATTTKAHDPLNAVHVAQLRDGEQVDIVVSLKLRNKTGLDALTAKLMSGAAGVKPLTSAEFLANYAPTAAQAAAVVDYLRAQGFVDIEVAPNNLIVSATGGAGSIRSAFKADLHEYEVDGRRAYANVTDAEVPAHLGNTVLGVVGLQNVNLMHTFARRIEPDATSPQATASITGISPQNFPAIYGASSLASASTATIGIITQGSVTQTITDLKAFAAAVGYPVPTVVTTVVGTASTDTSGVDEWNMDTQTSLAAAGGTIKQMILYNVNSLSDANLTKGYNKAVTDNLAKAINVSLGGCETSEKSVEATQDAIFQTAVAQGQVFSVSSGDSGAYECGSSGGKVQSYPAVSPYVMAIGGTTLTTTGGNTWSAETVWSCTSPPPAAPAAARRRPRPRRRGRPPPACWAPPPSAACPTSRSTPRRTAARWCASTAATCRSAAPACRPRCGPASGRASSPCTATRWRSRRPSCTRAPPRTPAGSTTSPPARRATRPPPAGTTPRATARC
jgi:pseudomonalisin/xanthomonalisin